MKSFRLLSLLIIFFLDMTSEITPPTGITTKSATKGSDDTNPFSVMVKCMTLSRYSGKAIGRAKCAQNVAKAAAKFAQAARDFMILQSKERSSGGGNCDTQAPSFDALPMAVSSTYSLSLSEI